MFLKYDGGGRTDKQTRRQPTGTPMHTMTENYEERMRLFSHRIGVSRAFLTSYWTCRTIFVEVKVHTS